LRDGCVFHLYLQIELCRRRVGDDSSAAGKRHAAEACGERGDREFAGGLIVLRANSGFRFELLGQPHGCLQLEGLCWRETAERDVDIVVLGAWSSCFMIGQPDLAVVKEQLAQLKSATASARGFLFAALAKRGEVPLTSVVLDQLYGGFGDA